MHKIQHFFKVEPSIPIVTTQPSDISTVNKFDVVSATMDKCQEIRKTLKSGNPVSYLEKLKLSQAVVSNYLVKNCGVFATGQQKELKIAFPPLKGVDGAGYARKM